MCHLTVKPKSSLFLLLIASPHKCHCEFYTETKGAFPLQAKSRLDRVWLVPIHFSWFNGCEAENDIMAWAILSPKSYTGCHGVQHAGIWGWGYVGVFRGRQKVTRVGFSSVRMVGQERVTILHGGCAEGKRAAPWRSKKTPPENRGDSYPSRSAVPHPGPWTSTLRLGK